MDTLAFDIHLFKFPLDDLHGCYHCYACCSPLLTIEITGNALYMLKNLVLPLLNFIIKKRIHSIRSIVDLFLEKNLAAIKTYWWVIKNKSILFWKRPPIVKLYIQQNVFGNTNVYTNFIFFYIKFWCYFFLIDFIIILNHIS